MFTVVYLFSVKPEKQHEFESLWLKVTQLIYQHCGSLGSRLHQPKKLNYIAYAQWPDEETFNNASNVKEAVAVTQATKSLRECCNSVDVLHKLHVAIDFLKQEKYTR